MKSVTKEASFPPRDEKPRVVGCQAARGKRINHHAKYIEN